MPLKDWIIVVLIVAVGILGYNSYRGTVTNNALSTQYKQLAENVARANTKVVSHITRKDISDIVKKAIKNETIQMKGTINTKQKHTSQSGKQNSKDIKKYSSVEKELYWKNDSGQKLPVGVTIYEKNRNRWLARTYGMTFTTNIVQAKKYDGSYDTIVEQYANVPHRKGYEDINYKMHIDNANFEVRNPHQLTWSWWNPNVSLGIVNYPNGLKPVLGGSFKFNFMNMGYTKDLPDYSFLSPVVMYNPSTGKGDVGLEFGSVNIGQWLPVIKDTHVGIGMTINRKPFIEFTSTL